MNGLKIRIYRPKCRNAKRVADLFRKASYEPRTQRHLEPAVVLAVEVSGETVWFLFLKSLSPSELDRMLHDQDANFGWRYTLRQYSAAVVLKDGTLRPRWNCEETVLAAVEAVVCGQTPESYALMNAY